MDTNLKYKNALYLLQLANKLENSITSDNESLDLFWYSLVQLHGVIQPCVELLRHRKLFMSEFIPFMETISSISYSIPENSGETHSIDKPADSPCTSTQNVQNTSIIISLIKKCAEKTQDEVITKLDAPLRFKKIKIIQFKSEDIIRNKTMICAEKIHVAREKMLTRMLISSKYKSLLDSDTWGNDVLPELNNSSEIIDSITLHT